MREKRQYTEDEKRGALGVLSHLNGDCTLTAKRLGYPVSVIREWKKEITFGIVNLGIENVLQFPKPPNASDMTDTPEIMQNNAVFEWTPVRLKAAVLVAEDKLSDIKIAEECGLTRDTITRWRREPEFMERVFEHRNDIRQEIRNLSIIDIANRVKAQDYRWRELQRVVSDRAVNPDMAPVPGGQTGLLVRTIKIVGKGEDAQVVEEYAVDTGLLSELRALETQVAKELGQWTEKRSTTVNGDTRQTVIVQYRDEDIDPAETARRTEADRSGGEAV